MKTPHKEFCVLPWVSLEASPVGTVRPCCLSRSEVLDVTGEKFHLAHASLDSIQHSDHMRKLRRAFLDGERPTDCDRCWAEESSGRTSKRMHTLDRLKHMIQDADWTEEAKPLMFLDLKLGNICNLKCRICGAWSSSTFASEDIMAVEDPRKRKQTFAYTMLRAGEWPRQSPEFWKDLEHHLDHIHYIEFTGGEPFMIQEHFDMLQVLVDRGIAHQVEIHYNTNGTHYPAAAEQIWKNFRTVEIAFSIDDLGDRFEYQRTNAVWSEVNHNIERFRDLRARYPNIQLQVCSTVNIFNVWHLEGLAEWIDMQNFDFVYWNMLHEARHFNIASLPLAAKQRAAQRLDTATVRDFHRKEFDQIREFMMAGESMPAEQICQQLKQLDQRRGQNLRDVIWELAESLGYDCE